ncbi:MIP/aquaporin family protein [uncultured Draconibacterium sp.]|uniref:MIP/aquaporin family protein n=1 Tax=uncultured Draconibacterium sp. TaxID=1573823 RepID=UPI002AA72F73|nr:MIP/aquaporin family protein [uncultured Draconibacterium sp.]
MRLKKEFIGEAMGTFILVLFGCGSVAVSILFEAFSGLFQIAIIWGIGVTLAIYLTRHISCAHLNPAVSLSMAVSSRMKWAKLPIYLFAQFFGAFLAGLILYVFFAPSIENYEQVNAITRGAPESIQTAKMFGEYYSIPGNSAMVSMPLAMATEAFGTFILVLLIFALTEGCNVGKPHDNIAPLFIGLTVTAIICLIAPLTQAGINPARDFGPRLVALLFGWGKAAFPDNHGGFLFVYILSPLIGGVIAAAFFTKVLEPAMNTANRKCCEK